MFNFFKRKKPTPDKTNTAKHHYAPETHIKYDENLVPSLIDEHQLLLSSFTQTLHAFEANNAGDTRKNLIQFKDLLRGHLLKENTLLYVYLKYATKKDEYSNELVTEMQVEMGKIGREVFNFLKKWTDPDAQYFDNEFGQQLKDIGAILTKRIENEENSLYVIYKEPSEYA